MINLSGQKCLLDTNILVALLNRGNPNFNKAKILFQKLTSREFTAVISSQNIFELTAVLVHGQKEPRKKVAQDIDLLTKDPLLQVIYPDFRVMDIFIRLLKSEGSLHIADLYLLATTITFDIGIIITADENFKKLNNITTTIYNPFN